MANIILIEVAYLTELNMDVRVSNVVTHKTMRPGTTSLGTRNDSQDTMTKIIDGIYV